MNGHRFKLWFVLLVALLPIACECGDCCCESPERTTPSVVFHECPHDYGPSEFANLYSRLAVRARAAEWAQANAVTDNTINTPEYNDCQRFILDDAHGRRYGGRYTIFAARLHDLASRLADANGGPVHAALVFSPDSTPYAPLGLTARWHCLALAVISDRQPSLEAAMIPVSSPGVCLFRDSLSIERGTRLTPQVVGDFSDPGREDRVPPVARWGYDAESRTQYAIIKCGGATCYVGRRDLTPRTLPNVPAAPVLGTAAQSPRLSRVFQVAGWHDTQPLAVMDPATMQIVPSRSWASVIPHPDLGMWNSPSDFKDKWVHVAWVAVDSDVYRDKLGLTRTREGGALNRVFACHGSCEGAVACPSQDSESKGPHGTKITWRTMIISTEGDRKFLCSIRYDDVFEAPVPATARFRWLKNDEQLWYRCMEGCCDTEDP